MTFARMRLVELPLFVCLLLIFLPKQAFAQDNCVKYQVKPGDNISSIAREHLMLVEDLVELNGITDSNSVRVGQVIDISCLNQSEETSGEVAGVYVENDNVWLDAPTIVAFALGLLSSAAILFEIYHRVVAPVNKIDAKMQLIEEIILKRPGESAEKEVGEN